MIYRFRALDAELRLFEGTISARHPEDLRSALASQGLDVLRIRRLAAAARQRTQLLTEFCQQLAPLLAAGFPLLEALDLLTGENPSPAVEAICRRLHYDLRQGLALSAAMRRQPDHFDATSCSLIEAGELSGQLPEILSRLGTQLQRSLEDQANTRSAMLYPSLSALVAIGACGFLLVTLVPQIRQFLSQMGGELPIVSRALFAVSDFLQAAGLSLLGLLLMAAISAWSLTRHHPGLAQRWAAWQFTQPVFGQIRRHMLSAHCADLLSLLHGAGIPMLQAIDALAASVDNIFARQSVISIGEQVRHGAGLYASFSRHRIFTPSLHRMLRIGEATGDLSKPLQLAAHDCRTAAQREIKRLQTLLEPTMTLLIGLLLGWVMLATLQPIYAIIGRH